jgi:hypothetical protein
MTEEELAALDLLGRVWGRTHDVGVRHDGTWWARRKDGESGTQTARSAGDLHKLITAEDVFLSARGCPR